MPRPAVRRALLCLAALTLAACARPDVTQDINDPFEAQNRSVHAFNKGVDRVMFRPASEAYGRVLPGPVRDGVTNFSDNLSLPGYVLNDVLQGQGEDAGSNFFRFLLNSSLGVGGVFDPASSFGLAARDSDFGETLYVWGVPEGAYIELPVLGPSTARDAVGEVVDIVASPLGSALPDDVRTARWTARVGEQLDERYRFGETIDQVLYESADSYAQARDIYLQNRRFELGGEQAEAYFDPYEDLYAE